VRPTTCCVSHLFLSRLVEWPKTRKKLCCERRDFTVTDFL
jgi:hypothetical protein